MTETILPPDANRTETHLISKGSAPQVSPDGSAQLLTPRRGSREREDVAGDGVGHG